MKWNKCFDMFVCSTQEEKSPLTRGSRFLLLSSFNVFSIKKWCKTWTGSKCFYATRSSSFSLLLFAWNRNRFIVLSQRKCLSVLEFIYRLQTWISNLSLSGCRVHSSPLQHRELHLLQPSPLRGARSDTPLCPQPVLPALQQTLV